MEQDAYPPLPYPDATTVQGLLELFAEQSDNFRSPHVPPHPAAVQRLTDILNQMAEGLANPGWMQFEGAFDERHAPVNLVLGTGPVFQLVSFNRLYSSEAGMDALLRDPGDWDGKALAIGGVVEYAASGGGQAAAPSRVLAVLLRPTPAPYDQKAEGLRYELWDGGPEPVDGAEAMLLELAEKTEKGEPYSFFLADRAVFSQFQLQACLQWTVPADRRAQAAIDEAVAELTGAGVLPARFVVNAAGARATLLSAPGGAGLADDELVPDIILAAARSFDELPREEGDALALDDVDDGEIDVTYGDAVLVATRALVNRVATATGEVVTLEPGSYRLDIVDSGADLMVGQIVSDGRPEYYLPLRFGQLQGTPWEAKGEPCGAGDGMPQVGIDAVCIFDYCKKKKPRNNPRHCIDKPKKWLVEVCFDPE